MDDKLIHLLLVDDEHSIREPLGDYLAAQGFEVDCAADAGEARLFLQTRQYDLVISDIMMPGEDGLSLARHMHGELGLPVILLTAKAEEGERVTGLEIGADDYVVKPFGPRELVARIHAVLRRAGDRSGRTPTSNGDTVYRFAEWHLRVAERAIVHDDGRQIDLSAGEFALLEALLRHPRKVLSRDRLLDLVRGRDADVMDRAIDNLVSRLRRKLDDDARGPALIRTIWGGGYSLNADVTTGDMA